MIPSPSRFWLVLLLGLFAFTVSPSRVVGAESEQQNRPPLPHWRDNSGMVFVRGGDFVRADEHKVRVRSFYIDRYEVTNEQYCEFLNDGYAAHFDVKQEIEKRGDRFVPRCCKERWPVYAVSWDDAVAYARWTASGCPPRRNGNGRPRASSAGRILGEMIRSRPRVPILAAMSDVRSR